MKLIYNIFKISFDEIDSKKRNFKYDDIHFKKHIEFIGKNFVIGYNTSLLKNNTKELSESLDQNIDKKFLGFAYEGAAMGLVIADFLKPWKNNFNEFLKGPGNKHEYMLYVGAGWAMRRLPFKKYVYSKINKCKSILSHLIFDGMGFHDGYFGGVENTKNKPKYLKNYQKNTYDQGVGRSLWFLYGGNAQEIYSVIKSFDESRQPDLWSGLGLASTYAGGRQDSLIDLKNYSGKYFCNLAQGCCFAAKARQRAENVSMHNKYACQAICNMTLDKAAKLTDDCYDEESYQLWQSKIQNKFK